MLRARRLARPDPARAGDARTTGAADRVQLQEEYLELAKKYVDDRLGSDADAQTVDVLERWESVLTRLAQDPMLCARELDWVAKLKLLNSYRDRDGIDWDNAKLQLIDYQYSDVRPDKGLYHRLVQLGRIDRLLDDDAVERAMHHPPEDTRAYFRGRCLEKYADSVAAASWDSVIFDLPGRESLQRVPTIDPLRGSKAHVAALIDRCDTRRGAVPRPDPLGGQRSAGWRDRHVGASSAGERLGDEPGRLPPLDEVVEEVERRGVVGTPGGHRLADLHEGGRSRRRWTGVDSGPSRSPVAGYPLRPPAPPRGRPRHLRRRGRPRPCEPAGQEEVVGGPALHADADAVAVHVGDGADGPRSGTTYTPSISAYGAVKASSASRSGSIARKPTSTPR